MIFNTSYGTYPTYEAFRDALIAESENATLFLRGQNGTVQALDLDNYSDTHSIAIGYGFDLLVRNNTEINSYFNNVGVPALSAADETILEKNVDPSGIERTEDIGFTGTLALIAKCEHSDYQANWARGY